jgi:hypothetical protein
VYVLPFPTVSILLKLCADVNTEIENLKNAVVRVCLCAASPPSSIVPNDVVSTG